MKKILLILIVTLTFLLTGCGDNTFYDSKTISILKTISHNDTTYEETIAIMVYRRIRDDYDSTGLKYKYIVDLFNKLSIPTDNPDLYSEATKAKLIDFIKKKIKWEVEGTTKLGKIVNSTFKYEDFVASYSIQTERDGDYLVIRFNDITRIN